MNGAESCIRTAVACGIEVCFANPGTTELPLVAALDAVGGIRPVLGLFEGVCTGAADGYGRMAGRPAMTLLHLGPGLANGLANLHNARRSRTPVLSVVGDHATWHRDADAPLTTDVAALARPVSGWVRQVPSAASLARDTAAAVAAAGRVPGRVATLIVPSDCQWDAADGPAPPPVVPAPPPVADAAVGAAAGALRAGGPAALLLGGQGLGDRGLRAAARIAAASGCALLCETWPARLERGRGRPALERLPYFPERATASLARFASVVLAGTPPPVAFFGYPGHPSRLIPPGVAVTVLAAPEDDVAGALEALADLLGAPAAAQPAGAQPAGAQPAPPASQPAPPASQPGTDPDPTALPRGPLDPRSAAAAIAAALPEGAIVMDESLTASEPFFAASAASPPHTYLALTGGAIGEGLPCATGAAVACPGRRVIAYEADGSGMYTLQALWTQAREGLAVTTLICSNRRYHILGVELRRAGVDSPGRGAAALTALDRPPIDWCRLAGGLGVPAERVETADELHRALGRALAQPGPSLIELLM